MKSTFKAALTTIACACAMVSALAQTTVIGEGRTPIGAGDPSSIRNLAKQEAMRDAVVKAIKDATALNAADPQFAPIINEIAKQLRDVKVREEVREGNDFVTRVEAYVDRAQIKNAIRGTELDKLNDRNFKMLLLVDEYVTTTRDLKIPLREITEYMHDAGSQFRDKSFKADSATAAKSASLAATSNTSAAASRSASSSGSYAGAVSATGQRGSVDAAESAKYANQASGSSNFKNNESLAATSSSQSAKASVDRKDVDQRSYDKESYRKLIEYQDNSKPTSVSLFLNEFNSFVRAYDLNVLDSATSRSKFFGDKKISMSTLENGAEMAKFNEFARKSNSDFLVVGSSTVITGDVNPSTGRMGCIVTASLRAFSTSTSEIIGGATEGAEAEGANAEACAAIASKKVAQLLAPKFAGQALGYWADRSVRGRQYTVEFRAGSSPLPMRLAFMKALRDIPGVKSVDKKEDENGLVKATLTLTGKGDATEEIYTAVSAQPAFSGKSLDATSSGDLISLCLDTCAAPAAKSAPKKK
ncbi:hypothetical protein [Rhodoferax mekongensis]|uniref:Uncharacterized protein n=1 Tax=Rhodoferax mekongensis TaxID=3068341 RepID=A0ABZ0AUQ1_9BURK|nr:hypothetical protein [Rhodoferax sp. TBRC 17307]WNO03388.1 hypothetical protein RAN89_10655 [Rhodoferax sp. TBRC 17307]